MFRGRIKLESCIEKYYLKRKHVQEMQDACFFFRSVLRVPMHVKKNLSQTKIQSLIDGNQETANKQRWRCQPDTAKC